MDLPIHAVLAALTTSLRTHVNAVLVAPPGAGKTTVVPLALLEEPWVLGRKLFLLSPRRLAARAAAERMAGMLGEAVGETIGLAVRLERRQSARTRIMVMTEGVFTRTLLADPELTGVAAVLFDEAHERALEADIGLAFALDAQAGLRPDLRLLAMSATLDGAQVAKILGDAPIIEAAGRVWPVRTGYLGRDAGRPLEAQMVSACLMALAEQDGDVLAFLPGAREIERTATQMRAQVGPLVDVHSLYGAVESSVQQAALQASAPGRRRVVLASAIAESSVTLDGVRAVVDSGLARRATFDAAVGLSRLTTTRVSRASADQRRGRAGRQGPGVCYRLWGEGEDRALPAFDPPAILEADLTGLALDCAAWGVREVATLAWLDPPPPGRLSAAQERLQKMAALTAEGRLTAHGRALAELPLSPDLAHMLSHAGEERATAAALAVLVSEPRLGGRAVDILERWQGWRTQAGPVATAARRLAQRWAKGCEGKGQPHEAEAGPLLGQAFPDRLALPRPGAVGWFVMVNGRAARLDPADPLALADALVVIDAQGRASGVQILSAARLTRAQFEQAVAGQIKTEERAFFDKESGRVRSERVQRVGALVLSRTVLAKPSGDALLAAWQEAFTQQGLALLPWRESEVRWRARMVFAAGAAGAGWPDVSDAGLLATFDAWAPAVLADVCALAALDPAQLGAAVRGLLTWAQNQQLEALAPEYFITPAGTQQPIDYAGAQPVVRVRVQEMFGLAVHPLVAGQPLTLELLSPAHRLLQTTADLPGFWAGSWRDVRADMRGRYPKHVWPENPAAAAPTTRAKPRGT